MRHHGLSWTEASQLPMNEVTYLLEIAEERAREEKSQGRASKRKASRSSQPGTRLEPIVS